MPYIKNWSEFEVVRLETPVSLISDSVFDVDGYVKSNQDSVVLKGKKSRAVSLILFLSLRYLCLYPD